MVRGTLAVRETPMVRWALAVMRLFIVRRAYDSHRGPTDETGQDIHKRPLGGKAWRDSDTSAPDTSGRPSPATKEQ